MRISSQQIFNIATNSMADANEAIVNTQQQLSTGQRVLKPSDDPVASTKILALTEELGNLDQYQKNIDLASNDLTLQEGTLDGVNNIVQRMQELAVQAGNTATLSPAEYKSLANEVDERMKEMVNLLNSRNAAGDYIFGGYKSTQPPFVGSASEGFNYVGDEGQKLVKVSNNTKIPATDSGKSIFVDINSDKPTLTTDVSSTNRGDARISVGNVVDQDAYNQFYPEDMVITFNQETAVIPNGKNFTVTEKSTGRVLLANQPYVSGQEITLKGASFYITGNPASAAPGVAGDQMFVDSSGKQDILTTMARFSDAMKNFDGTQASRDELSKTMATTMNNLKNAQTSVLQATSTIGARFNTLDSTKSQHSDSKQVLNELMSKLRDTDYAEAASRLSMQSMVLQAAQSSFVRITQLNLFDRL